jgi:hypothetical protein
MKNISRSRYLAMRESMKEMMWKKYRLSGA